MDGGWVVVGGGGAQDASYPISLPFLSSNPVSIFFLNLIYMYIYNLEYPYDTSLYFSQIPVLFFLHFTYSIIFLSLYPTSHHLCPLLSPQLRNVAEEKASGSAANQRRKVLMLNVFISSQAVPCFGILLPSIAILPSDATLNVRLKRIWSCTNL